MIAASCSFVLFHTLRSVLPRQFSSWPAVVRVSPLQVSQCCCPCELHNRRFLVWVDLSSPPLSAYHGFAPVGGSKFTPYANRGSSNFIRPPEVSSVRSALRSHWVVGEAAATWVGRPLTFSASGRPVPCSSIARSAVSFCTLCLCCGTSASATGRFGVL